MNIFFGKAYWWLLIVILLIMIASRDVLAAVVDVQLDRSQVAENESFQVKFIATETVDDEPDFSPLEKDFEILNRSKSSSMQIVNGNISRSTVWRLNLIAKTTGTIVIPAINFGADRSPVRRVTIAPEATASTNGGDNDTLFLDVDVNPKEHYVQAEIRYTIRFYHAVNTVNARLSEPEIEGIDAVVMKIGEDKSFEARRHGKHYRVYERRYAIFPQTSGEIRLAPIVFDGQIVNQRRQIQNKRLRSPALKLDILPAPNDFGGKTWLPARKLSLVEQWPDGLPRFVVGEPITRRIVLQAHGLTAAQLPALEETLPASFKAYREMPELQDQASEEGIIGTRQEAIALIASTPGKYTLPALSVSWWNTETGKEEHASLPARNIDVIAAPVSRSNLAPVPQPETISTPNPPVSVDLVAQRGFWPGVTVGIILALFLLPLARYLVLKITKKSNSADAASATDATSVPVGSPASALKRVTAACRCGDLQRIKQAVLTWGEARWPEMLATSLTEIGRRLGADGQHQIHALEAALYSNRKEVEYNPELLLATIKQYHPLHDKAADQQQLLLPPLYP